jgi:hypothetical protein
MAFFESGNWVRFAKKGLFGGEPFWGCELTDWAGS